MKLRSVAIVLVGAAWGIVAAQTHASSRGISTDQPTSVCDLQFWSAQAVDPYAAVDGNTDGLGDLTATTDTSFFNPGTLITNGTITTTTVTDTNNTSLTVTWNIGSPAYCSPNVPLSPLSGMWSVDTTSGPNLASLPPGGKSALTATAGEIYEWVNPNGNSNFSPDAMIKIWNLPTGQLELEMDGWCTTNLAGTAPSATASFTWNGNIYTTGCSTFYDATGFAVDLLLNSSGVLIGYVGASGAIVTTSTVPGWQAIFATTTTLNVSPSSAASNSAVTMLAAVTGLPDSPAPAGSVTFYNGTTSLSNVTLNAVGAATYSIASLSVGGPYNITATYSGDPNHSKSSSTSQTLTITPAPNVAMSEVPIGMTVAPGQSAATTITLTPSNGFDQMVSMSCAGLPTGATCNFTPASVLVNGSASTSKLTIMTTGVTAMNSTGSPPVNPLIPGGVVLAGLGLPTALRRRRAFARSRQYGLFLLLLIFTVALPSCGGGSSGGGSSGGVSTGTPAGKYIVTITATAGSIARTMTYALTVN